MMAVAHFLRGEYARAKPYLLAVDRPTSPPKARGLAQLGLLGVYQKLDRPVDQLVTALRYESTSSALLSEYSPADVWSLGWWPQVGFLMDVRYLLDVQLTEDELRAARSTLEHQEPLTIALWSRPGHRTARDLVDYALAVRAARREAFAEAADLYTALGVSRRAQRMRTLARLTAADPSTSVEGSLRRRYEYGVFLADHSERVFFNDLLWSGYQQYAMLHREDRRAATPDLLGADEQAAFVERERRFKDAQEERWRAFVVLDDVVARAGNSSLGRRAARKAIEALDRIHTERFGRAAEIDAARTRLVVWLRSRRATTTGG
jgi:hypothetical protein